MQIALSLCSIVSALENIAESVADQLQVGESVVIATMSQFTLSVTATTPSSVPDEGLVLEATLEADITATLPVDLFDKFSSGSTVVQIAVSVVAAKELFPPKSGGTVSSVIFSLDVGIEISNLTEPIEICIPADPVSLFLLYKTRLNLSYVCCTCHCCQCQHQNNILVWFCSLLLVNSQNAAFGMKLLMVSVQHQTMCLSDSVFNFQAAWS